MKIQIFFLNKVNLSLYLYLNFEACLFNYFIQFVKIYHIFPHLLYKYLSSFPVKMFFKILKLGHYNMLIHLIRLFTIFLLLHYCVGMITNLLNCMNNRYLEILDIQSKIIKIIRVGHRWICGSRVYTKQVLLKLSN